MKQENIKVVTVEEVNNYVEMAALLTGASLETAQGVVIAFNMLIANIPAKGTKDALEELKEKLTELDTQEEC